MKKNILFLAFLFNSLFLFAQNNGYEGTRFWLSFLPNEPAPVLQIFISSRTAATGTISVPLDASFVPIPFSIPANSITPFIATISQPFGYPTNTEILENLGILITANVDISVSVLNARSTGTDATSIFPVENLGNLSAYIISSLGTLGIAEFVIVATENNTSVAVSLPPGVQTSDGSSGSFTVAMDAGQVFLVRGVPLGTLAGTRIESCKPLAVFSGMDRGSLTCGLGHLYTQLLPIQTWGTLYLNVPFNNMTTYTLQIIAAENNTNILINNVPLATLNKGQSTEQSFSIDVCISADKPIQVIQFMRGRACNGSSPQRGSPSMTVLSPVEQGIRSAVFNTIQSPGSFFDNNNDHFLTIISNVNNPANIRINLDGVNVNPATFSKSGTFNASCGIYSYGVLPIQRGTHRLQSDSLFLAYLHGYDNAGLTHESYFSSVGAATENITAVLTFSPPLCVNQPVRFNVLSLRSNIVNYEWDFDANGVIEQTGAGLATVMHTYSQSGTYALRVITSQNLGTIVCKDTLEGLVTIETLTLTLLPLTICEGSTGIIDGGGGFDNYIWTDANGNVLPGAGSNGRFLPVSQAGTYNLRVTGNGCIATASTTVSISKGAIFSINSIPTLPEESKVEFDKMAFLCEANNQQIQLKVESIGNNISGVIWSNGASGQTITVNRAGIYEATVFDLAGCASTDFIEVEDVCNPEVFVPTAFSPNNDGNNDNLEFFGKGFYKLNLKIFNRWGEIVFIGEKKKDTWDGNYLGKPVPVGAYVWVASYESVLNPGKKIETKGKVFIVR